MDTLIDNLLQRGTTCSVSKTTCFCNKTSREVYLEIGTHALMLICTFFCLLGRVALEDNLLDWRRSSLFLCLVLSRWGRDRVLVEPAWEAPALAVEADFFTCSLKVRKGLGIVKIRKV